MKVLAFPDPRRTTPDAEPLSAVAPTVSRTDGGDGGRHYDRITIRAITVAVVLSLFVHVVVLVTPWLDAIDQQMKAPADEIGPLSVTIAASKPQPPAPEPQPRQEPAAVQPTPVPQPQPKPVAKPPRPTPPRPRSQIAINNGRTPPFVVPPPTVAQPTVPQPPTPQAQPTPAPVVPTTDDFAETLAARQRARRAANGGAPDENIESDDQRATRIAKANIMAQQRSASPGQDPDQAGGIFDLRHTGLNEAEFVFNGWNRDFRRAMPKTIEVRTGNNPDIRIAVIRQMIQIIREQRPGDFEWYNPRTGKSVVMSARPKDQPELELFLMKEFYPQDPRVNGKARSGY